MMFIKINIDHEEKRTVIKERETTNIFIIENVFLRENHICKNYILIYEIT